MKSVFLLQHLHMLPGGEESVKIIGIYQSKQAAQGAIERLKTMPGFSAHPMLVDPLIDEDLNGFYIDEYLIDQDHWAEGYVTE
jgi:hypothetical protein